MSDSLLSFLYGYDTVLKTWLITVFNILIKLFKGVK